MLMHLNAGPCKTRSHSRARLVLLALLSGELVLVLATDTLLLGQSRIGQAQPTVGQPGKDVEWVPTPPELINQMLEMAEVSPQDVVMDLGSGDGRLVIAAARLGARAIGIEYDPGLVALSTRNATAAGVLPRTTFMNVDLFDVDLSSATVITMFLLPDINLALRPKLLQLPPGTRIVSNTWSMEDWTADETVVIEPCPSWCTALLWIVPAQVGGVWQLPQSTLVLEQRFQEISGTLRSGHGMVQITEGRLRGNQISFRAGEKRYTGYVHGVTIQGVAKTAMRAFDWSATRIEH